ncbi:hypothetical protein GBAR_LOCUS17130 [Geodia barretti]|uniref:Uncharacterized protein n=1 Tax=Geodia barretti TaxID=519541 RepID=A0AA35WVA7_GEOBA|nr:hypothetical protein GBAR_LOCUS17130 [Geodia barretti]
MRESIQAIRCDFLCLQGTHSKRTRSRSVHRVVAGDEVETPVAQLRGIVQL